jgi:hypothetical protein
MKAAALKRTVILMACILLVLWFFVWGPQREANHVVRSILPAKVGANQISLVERTSGGMEPDYRCLVECPSESEAIELCLALRLYPLKDEERVQHATETAKNFFPEAELPSHVTHKEIDAGKFFVGVIHSQGVYVYAATVKKHVLFVITSF